MKLPVNYEELHWTDRKKVREEYVKIQDGKCHHCGSSLFDEANESRPINKKLFPKGFFDYPIHLHHCHKTGMTIGALHNRCNAALWQYEGE